MAALLPAPWAGAQEVTAAGVAGRPTLAIVNGRVWPGVRDAPKSQAIAITGSRISAVGGNEEIRALVGPDTLVIDAGQRRVIPGISDSHTHIIDAGLQLSRTDLRGAASKEHFVDLVTAGVTRLSPGQWLLGGRFTVESWDNPESPRKEWIDPITPGNPVFLTRMDGHQALVNSVALKVGRVDRRGPADPPGGEIERDPDTGEPTGILKDAAMDLVSNHIPPVGNAVKYDAFLLACQVANAWGITSIHDMSSPDDLVIFKAAHEQNAATLRVNSYVYSEDFQSTWPTIREFSVADDRLKICGFKAFMDGSLGSRTAYMRDPFTDARPDAKYPRGLRSAMAVDLEKFAAQIRWAHNRNQQLAVHAIGDQAIHELLDIYKSLPDCKGRRHRIEHTQHLLPGDIRQFPPLGVIASMQPLHKADDGRYAEKAIGPERALTSYAFKSLIRGGATLVFGSDVPVVTNNPFRGMAAAVTARTLEGRTWVPSQRITLEQALWCYTVTPPYAVFQEKKLGTIEVAKLADIVILDQDILTEPIDRIHETEAFMTIWNGRVVWRKP
jgi:predicted amidohydrolase YtcJ